MKEEKDKSILFLGLRSPQKPNPWEEKFDPLGAVKRHPGFMERLIKEPGNKAAVEAWLGITIAELKKQGYT